MENNPREYCMNDIIAAKHYPQVLRVTRPYYVNQREYLSAGQYITLLDRRRVELITGDDRESRPFKIRKDRPANVEIIENDRIVHSLKEVAEVSNHITGIELAKELRSDRQIFPVGEKFTIAKIGKSFRGRRKNITLRREKESKEYRLPLDTNGTFKLIVGKTNLPLTKLLSLRTLPLRAKFRNTPTSSNFPSGISTIRDSVLCDIVYILTVQSETYTYEAFSLDGTVYVEKCNLLIPKPILNMIPNGTYVNSSEFTLQIKNRYRQRISDIDSNLTEDIYASGYYGSATYERNTNIDNHLLSQIKPKFTTIEEVDNSVSKTALSDISSNTSNASTPDSEQSGPPVFPRHSKSRKYRQQHSSFPAIQELDWSKRSCSEQQISKQGSISSIQSSCYNSADEEYQRGGIIELETEGLTIQMSSNFGRICTGSGSSRGSGGRISLNSMTGPQEIRVEGDKRNGDSPSIKVYCMPDPNTSAKDRLVTRYYDTTTNHLPSLRLHSRSSSVTTEDSVDSGVVLTIGPSSHIRSGPGNGNIYSDPENVRNSIPDNTVRRITMPALTTPEPQGVSTKVSSPSYGGYSKQDMMNNDVNPLVKKQIDVCDQNNNINNNSNSSSKTKRRHSLYTYSVATNDSPKQRAEFRRQSIQIENNTQQVSKQQKPLSVDTIEVRIEEIRRLSQEDTGRLLKCLNLSKYVSKFQSELINGHLLLELDEETLRRDLSMTAFDARKLYKYVHGWRPTLKYADNRPLDPNPELWSVSNVIEELKNIKLQVLSIFCEKNHVDGLLLLDIVQSHTIMEAMTTQHGIQLSGLEQSRLKAFVLKKWRPDDSKEIGRKKSTDALPTSKQQQSQKQKQSQSQHHHQQQQQTQTLQQKRHSQISNEGAPSTGTPVWTRIMNY